jgi:hypothetical protein
MNRTPIHYSNLESYGYDRNSHTLELEMNGGQLYEYDDVQAEIYQGLVEAINKDYFFEMRIDGRFARRQLR